MCLLSESVIMIQECNVKIIMLQQQLGRKLWEDIFLQKFSTISVVDVCLLAPCTCSLSVVGTA